MATPSVRDLRIVVMISGSGSNLQAMLDAQVAGRLPSGSRVALVVSNRESAYGLQRAQQACVPTLVYSLLDDARAACASDRDRLRYDAALAARIKAALANEAADAQPALIVLAGWMHVLSDSFLQAFECPVINIHPALPGAFDGKDAIARAYAASRAHKEAGLQEPFSTGVMVHHVTTVVDGGRVIVSQPVPIHRDDRLEDLEQRMHEVEHVLIVSAVNKVLLRDDSLPDT